MREQSPCYAAMVESRYPGLIAEARKIITASERRYEGKTGRGGGFLWEHTTHVASLAYRLAVAEKQDPLLPAVAALFHDAGKFARGRYHEDRKPEEEEAGRIAGRVLAAFGMAPTLARKVVSGLRALYKEGAARNAVARAVHDADFLSKFGALGVGNFFLKSALRGRTLNSAAIESLSKELTYAACLPLNMHTPEGRRLAVRRAARSLKFFDSLFSELREAGIADLRVRKTRVPCPGDGRKSINVRLVSPRVCPTCGGSWQRRWTTEVGLKCRRLIVETICGTCKDRLETSFCLPEVVGS